MNCIPPEQDFSQLDKMERCDVGMGASSNADGQEKCSSLVESKCHAKVKTWSTSGRAKLLGCLPGKEAGTAAAV